MTEEEIKGIVQSISRMLDINSPTVEFEEYWNGVYLEVADRNGCNRNKKEPKEWESTAGCRKHLLAD